MNSLEKWPIPDVMHIGSKLLKVVIMGEAVAQERPRFFKGHAYDPKKSRDYKKYVKGIVEEEIKKSFWKIVNAECPVKVKMVIYKPFDVNDTLWVKAAGEAGYIAPLKRSGDIENICKGIMDACTGVVYEDDCQVYSLQCEIRYSFIPRVELTVEAVYVSLADVKEKGTRLRQTEEFLLAHEQYRQKVAENRKKVLEERKKKVAKEMFSALKEKLPTPIKRRAKETPERPQLEHIPPQKRGKAELIKK